MSRRFIYLIYNLLLPVVLLLGLPAFLIKGWRRGGLARNFRQRLGWFKERTLSRFSGERPIWIHAVSVGEILLALKVIEAVHAKAPGKKIVLSTTTTTGFQVADEHRHDFLTVIHNPVDLPFITARVIRLIRPEQLILIEAEIWPNLVGQLKRKGIPVNLVNARLSPRSQKRYLKFRSFVEPIFSLLDHVTVPFETDIDRWSALGIEKNRIQVVGSVKFDNTLVTSDQLKIDELQRWLSSTQFPKDGQILLAGSTHEGEELMLADIARDLKKKYPELELVIVPRHAERGEDVARQTAAQEFNPVLRTHHNSLAASEETAVDSSETSQKVWIANTTGELRAWYNLADLVVIGKSFRGEGGQNPVEPILTGKPTIVGPNMQNFSEVVEDLVSAKGICQVNSESDLAEAIANLLNDHSGSLEMAMRGAKAMERHRGASTRTAELILGAFSHPT